MSASKLRTILVTFPLSTLWFPMNFSDQQIGPKFGALSPTTFLTTGFQHAKAARFEDPNLPIEPRLGASSPMTFLTSILQPAKTAAFEDSNLLIGP